MKKLLILASMAVLLVMWTPKAEANTTTEAPTPYTDISGHWAQKEIEKLYIGGALGQAESFRPNDLVTRQELISMFILAMGVKPSAEASSSFADIPSDSWLAPYAEAAYRLGLVHGQKMDGQVYFQPDATVSREELASILIRATGESGAVNKFSWSTTVHALAAYADGSQVQERYQRPMVYAMQIGLISPYADQTLRPQQLMTRAEAATYAALHLLENREGKPVLSENGTPFREVLTVKTTAYSYDRDDVLSYLEFPLREGIVAVDPEVIPLGTHLYVEGYGYAVAADIGGAVKQNHLDLFLPSLDEAKKHGMQEGVKVYILD
ncbi:S-layer homology domain-containing protein [Brevibacillus sp. AY1]|uniref:S-layer homology domain-containing protein n=1 Tax=Brevibacillus sp. AY1 TaxID=2807621 RepID=UPI002458FA39|nr:S-layer homology domain-containing protein [Brevibacillus sp. AY1]MDH4618165.1 S-layer homology domain-containing protein [Brevibacillus sp. AY1]